MRIARHSLSVAVSFAALLLFAGCASKQEPAEQALAKVEASLAEVRADAEKYAADDLKPVDESVTKLKNEMAGKNYSAVLMGAPGVNSAIMALKTKIESGRADAEATLAAAQSEWTDLSANVPPMVEKLQAKMDSITKTKKLPKGMDKTAFETAKANFETLKTSWTEAASEFAQGQAANAVRKAREAKARAEELTSQLEPKA
jgi:hypothetical protein